MTLKEQDQRHQGMFELGKLVDLIDIEKRSLTTMQHQG